MKTPPPLLALLLLLLSFQELVALQTPPLVDLFTKQPIRQEQLEAAKEVGISINEIRPKSPALRSGLSEGDIIVGYAGVRVYDQGEIEVIRYQDSTPADIPLVINHQGEFRTVVVHTVEEKSVGYVVDRSHPPITQVADLLGIRQDPSTLRLLQYYPARAVGSFLEWRATAGPSADTTWFRQNVNLYAGMRRQDYSSDNGAEVPTPVPFIERLTKYYRTICACYRLGPHVMDWKSYGGDRLFWALYYPCPMFVVDWGNPSIADRRFAAGMLADKDALNRPSSENEELAQEYVQQAALTKDDPVEAFICLTKAALLDSNHQGGWPIRYESLPDKAYRTKLLDGLRSRVRNKSEDWIVAACAMVGPLIMNGSAEEMVEVLKTVTDVSPYLGEQCAEIAMTSLHFFPCGVPKSMGPLMSFVFSSQFFQREKAVPFHRLVMEVCYGPVPFRGLDRPFDPEYLFNQNKAGLSGILEKNQPQEVRERISQDELNRRALSLYCTNQLKAAYELLEQIKASSGPTCQNEWIMGLIQSKAGDHVRAQAHYEKGLELFSLAEKTAQSRACFIGNLLEAYQNQGGKQALYRQGLHTLEAAAKEALANYRNSPAGKDPSAGLPLDVISIIEISEVCRATLLGAEGDWEQMAKFEEKQIATLHKLIPEGIRQPESLPTTVEQEKNRQYYWLVRVLTTACEKLVVAYQKMDEPARALEIAKEWAKLPNINDHAIYAKRAQANVLWLEAVVNGPTEENLQKAKALITEAEKTLDSTTILTARLLIPRLLALQGSNREARAEFDDVLQRIQATSNRHILAEAWEASAENHLALQKTELAQKEIAQAVDLFRLLGFKSEEPQLLIAYARVLAQQGKYAQSVDTLREGIRLCSTLKVPHLVARILLTLADIQRIAGDLAGAEETWAQIDSFIASHPDLPSLTVLYSYQVRLDWLNSRGNEAAFAEAKQKAQNWLQRTWLNSTQGRCITSRVFSAPAASVKPKVVSARPLPEIDLQPLKERTEVGPGEVARARFTVANLGTVKAMRPVRLQCPGYAADWSFTNDQWKVLLHPEPAAPEASTRDIEIGPGEEVLLFLEATAGKTAPQSATLSIAEQSATWNFVWGDDHAPISVVSASTANDNPFYRVSFFHDIRLRNKANRANLRVETSEPCRVEMVDADRDTLIAIDASGRGTFRNLGDQVYADADGDGFPELSRTDEKSGVSLELRVYPLKKNQPGKIEIKVSVKTDDNQWEGQAIDELIVH